MLAKELLKIEQEEAKLNQGKRNDLSTSSIPLPNVEEDQRSMSKTAKKVGLKSGEQLRRILKIEELAPEELKEKVRSGQTSINYAYKTINRQEKKANAQPIPRGEFDVILADPPWTYDINTRGSPDDHYDTMSDNEIYNMKIPSLDY